ncbi:MAG: hypothetical protein A2Y10_00750 [Planctomycetes bacterium GWF2_41_51]|nr:MAG: hypothetical protein A2Y10_00750 [Planctomycetes bacterium GWF2_41_51]HBG26740.1 hypothetical protein [Phycisphaerales bacterium]
MNKNTVYVIGAGASKEANLPTGHELKREISDLLDIRFDEMWRQKSGDYLITEALYELVKQPNGQGGNIKPYLQEAWHIRDALPQAISIDNFIDAHRDNDKITICGKLAIVISILNAEKSSLLYFQRSQKTSTISFSYLEATWYLPFFQMLTENCAKADLKDRFLSISLIVFNYDRCIEHFMYHALRNYYRVSNDEAVELIRCINIYHPYGSIGSLPWLASNDSIEFGADIDKVQLLQLSKKIKTFAEGTDPNSSDITAIKKLMEQAKRLVFIGFAFHKLNMQLIALDTESKEFPLKCYATTFNISKSDEEIIRDQIKELYNNAIIDTRMANIECAKFFSEFWRSLSF